MLSRKSATIFGQGTIPEPSTSHIGKGVALVAQTAAFVYIYARIPQIAEMTLSFHATLWEMHARERRMPIKDTCLWEMYVCDRCMLLGSLSRANHRGVM